jgi:hypothetical protein
MLRLKFTPTFSHPSLSLRQLLCALRSPARRAQDPMLRLQSKFTPSPSFDFRLALFFEEPFIRHAHSGWCPVLAARGVCVVLHTFASGTLFSPAERNSRGGGPGEFLTALSRFARCGITGLLGVLVPCCSSTIRGTITARHCDYTFGKKVGEN